jgi:hypothetical protein
MNDELNFLHIRNLDKRGTIDCRGGATVAFRETTPGTIQYATAFCSPQDNFNKAYGRSKAAGRLNSERFALQVGGFDLSTFRKNVLDGDFVI